MKSPLPPISPEPHLGPVYEDQVAARDRFDADELAVVMSHYDLGVIGSCREYRRGSRRSPKVRIVSERGTFLLKRRAPGRDDQQRVALTQDLQVFLESRRYPVPGLIRTHRHEKTVVRFGGHVYEMFRFIEGTRYDRSAAGAEQSGRALGWLHRLLRHHRTPTPATEGSFHAARGLERALEQIPARVASVEPRVSKRELRSRCRYLRDVYHDAGREADAAGLSRWPREMLHGDWHPGNLLYRNGAIVAVLDFDSARAEPRMVDIANAALQFSMRTADPDDPNTWPESLDARRVRILLRGYDQAAAEPVTAVERRALPWLLLEALILESVLPIAATGTFAHLSGSSFLRMVDRKVRWIRPRASKLLQFLEEPMR